MSTNDSDPRRRVKGVTFKAAATPLSYKASQTLGVRRRHDGREAGMRHLHRIHSIVAAAAALFVLAVSAGSAFGSRGSRWFGCPYRRRSRGG